MAMLRSPGMISVIRERRDLSLKDNIMAMMLTMPAQLNALITASATIRTQRHRAGEPIEREHRRHGVAAMTSTALAHPAESLYRRGHHRATVTGGSAGSTPIIGLDSVKR